MVDLTPLEKLDDAIREYLAASDDDGNLTGWVLAYETSRLVPDADLLPLAFGSTFTTGASTSPSTAMGLAHLTAARIEAQLLFSEDDEDN